MSTTTYRWSSSLLALISALFLGYIFMGNRIPDLSFVNSSNLQTFKTMFISIILEAIPFVLLGVLLSSVLQVFVSEKTISRWVPKNPLVGILFACLLGVFFPVCECGLIPVVRRLIHKGMPIHVAMVFILTGPILNPVVYAATFMAFRTHPEMAYARMALAFFVAVAIGLLLYVLVKSNPLKESLTLHRHHDQAHEHHHDHAHDHHHHDHHHHHDQHNHRHAHHHHDHSHDHSHYHQGNKLTALLNHAADEFIDMGRYLMFGAILTGLIQTFMTRESLVSLGQGPVSSHLFMMGFAYILSLCSTSDAFVASSFLNIFSKGALLAFLVFGPMLDMKSTLMLFSVFKARFVLLFTLLIVVLVFGGSMLVERLYFV